MTTKKQHTRGEEETLQEYLHMISGASINWNKSKEQVWSDLEKRIETAKKRKEYTLNTTWLRIAVAAAVLILTGLAVFMQLYTIHVNVPAGKHLSISMPDNSKVRINAQSDLSYKPLTWRFSRKIKFEGEAYFEVKPGKKFEVISAKGTTMVMGTSFNVFSRGSNYLVTCVTGKVKVIENQLKNEIILNPKEKAELKPDGTFDIQSGINISQTISWLENRFSFTSVPLRQVFEEIGRQYDIVISYQAGIDYGYTGTFNRSSSVETTLNVVCKPFNLQFTRQSKNKYVVSESK
jgi:ferric-dicitrate binding protein FerR (iron transport regulator)